MKPNEMLATAISIAATAHASQLDRGGNPYILHPIAVMSMVDSNDPEVKAIAVLHDTVEDCGITYQSLIESGLSQRIVDGVRALTKIPGETYDEYKAKVKDNIDARLVKMADLTHNSDLRRLKGVTEKDIARAEKYMRFYYELRNIIV